MSVAGMSVTLGCSRSAGVLKVCINVHRSMRDANDSDVSPDQHIEDLVGALPIASITFSDLVARFAGVWMRGKPFESSVEFLQVFLGLLGSPCLHAVVGNAVEIAESAWRNASYGHDFEFFTARFLALAITSSTENATKSSVLA